MGGGRRVAALLLLPVALADHFPPPSSPPYPCGERCTSYIDAVGIPVVPSPGDVVCTHHSTICYTNYQDGCVPGESVLSPPSAPMSRRLTELAEPPERDRRRLHEEELCTVDPPPVCAEPNSCTDLVDCANNAPYTKCYANMCLCADYTNQEGVYPTVAELAPDGSSCS